MVDLNIKTAKLAMEADGNVIGNCFIVQPDKDLAKKLGVLFGIVEIYNINDTFIDGLLEAVKDLQTEYYLPPYNLDRGIEKRFEEALSRANRRIQNTIVSSIEEVDLRNVSAVLGVIYDNKVYISSTGRIKGLFARRKKNLEVMIFDILAGSQDKKFKPETEKVFANILSGELSEKDALIFINEEFLGLFSQNDLAEIALNNPADDAVKFIEASIKEKIAKKNFYAIALRPDVETEAEVAAPVADAEKPIARPTESTPVTTEKIQRPMVASQHQSIQSQADPVRQELNHKVGQAIIRNVKPQQSIDKLLYTQVKTEKYLTPSLMPNWQKFLILFWNGLKKYSNQAYRQTKKLSLSLIATIKAKTNKSAINTPAPTNQIKAPIKPLIQPIETVADIFDDEIDQAPAETSEDFNEERLSDQQPEELEPTEELTIRPATLTDKINNQINEAIVRFLDLRKTQQLAIVAALLLLFVFSQSIVMIGRSYDKTNGTGSGYDQIAKDIEEQLNKAEAQNIFNDEAGALVAVKKAKELLAEIPVKRSTNSLKQQLTDKINATGYNLQHITYAEEPKLLATFNKTQTLTDLVGLARTGQVFWAFNNNDRSLLRLDSLNDKLDVRTSTLPAIKKLAAIDDKNLILLAKSGEYFKYDINKQSATKISKPSKEYFLIKNPVNASPLLDPPLASSTIAMSFEADGYNWFLDEKVGKLIVFDKTGILKKQYASSKYVAATAMAAQYKEKKAWIFNSGKLYQVDLDF